MAYPTRYYDMQRAVMRDIGFAVRTGLCPVCRIRPRARWPDRDIPRTTCGAQTCFIKWLPVHAPTEEHTEP